MCSCGQYFKVSYSDFLDYGKVPFKCKIYSGGNHSLLKEKKIELPDECSSSPTGHGNNNIVLPFQNFNGSFYYHSICYGLEILIRNQYGVVEKHCNYKKYIGPSLWFNKASLGNQQH